jgi:signal transduction histidine kinase
VNVAVVVLVVALVAAGLMLLRRERERTSALELLGADRDTPLDAAVTRAMRGRVEREELSEALALRDAVLAAAPYPLLLTDSGGRLIRANPSARRALPGLVSGKPLEIGSLGPAVRDALAGRTPRRVEVTVYEPDRHRYHARIQPFLSRDGRSCAVVLYEDSGAADFRDARSLFSAGVSHELRTPLARMLALVDTLDLPLDHAERDGVHEQLREEIDGMRRLIEEMVLLVRLESGEQAGGGERSDVTDAVEQCVERHRDAAGRAGVSLSGNATRGIVAAIASPVLAALLDNLTGNAIRHAGSGADVRVIARGLSGAVEIEVADTGQGIPAEHLPHVFERFYRVEGSRAGAGTGLGLAIVKHIAEAHGGRAEIESEQGRGTTVRVILPTPAAARMRQGRSDEVAR